MNNSILDDIKKLLGIPSDYDAFNTDLVMHINTVFQNLYEMGFGDTAFSIDDSSSTWNQFFGYTGLSINSARTYVYLKVKQLFDPPQTSALIEAMNSNIQELEWRLYSNANFKEDDT